VTRQRLARWRDSWRALQERRPSVRNVVNAWGLLQRNNGNLYAAAITFFSFLALFPLLLLAVSVVGFALHSDPDLQRSLYAHVADRFPGRLGRTVHSSIETAIDNRSGVGVVGLAGVLLTGLGWIGNLRAAIDAVWARGVRRVNFLRAKLGDLLVLAGLGAGTALSLGLTIVGTSLTDQILRATDLDSVPGSTLLLKVLGIALAVAGDLVIFWWLLVRLPAVEVPERVAWRGALLAVVGFEVLKVLGTYTIAHTANSPTAGPFAGLVAVLVWIQLVARWLLFAGAWTATVTAAARVAAANQAPVDEPAVMAEASGSRPEVSPVAVGAGLVGAGAVMGAAVMGAAVTAVGQRRRRSRAVR
jgi:membrane protein